MSDGEVRDYRSLGEILRQTREKRGLSVEALAERTRIAPRMISALEHDDFAQLSSPVYARGFIKAVARELELDVDWLLTKVDLRDATAAVPETVKRPTAAAPAVAPTAPAPSERGPVWQVESVRVRKVEAVGSGPSIPPRALAIGIAIVVVVIGLVWAAKQFGGTAVGVGAERTAPTRETEAPPVGEGSNAAAADSQALAPDLDVTTTVVVTDTTLEVVGPTGSTGLPSIVRPDPAQQDLLSLVVRATSRVVVTVVVDGEPAHQRVLRAGESWALEGRDHFELEADDPAALEVELDGIRRAPPTNWAGEGWMLYRQNRRDGR